MILLIEKTLHRGRVRVISFQFLLNLAQNRLAISDLADHFEEEASFSAGGSIGGRDEEIVIEKLGSVESDFRDVGNGGVGRHIHVGRERLEVSDVRFGGFVD